MSHLNSLTLSPVRIRSHDVMMLQLSVWHVNILWNFYQNIYNSTLCGFFWSLQLFLSLTHTHFYSFMVRSLYILVWAESYCFMCTSLCHISIYRLHFRYSAQYLCTLAPWFIYVADNWFCVFVPNLFCALHFYCAFWLRVCVRLLVVHQNMLNWLILPNIKRDRVYVMMSVFLRKIKTLPEFLVKHLMKTTFSVRKKTKKKEIFSSLQVVRVLCCVLISLWCIFWFPCAILFILAVVRLPRNEFLPRVLEKIQRKTRDTVKRKREMAIQKHKMHPSTRFHIIK